MYSSAWRGPVNASAGAVHRHVRAVGPGGDPLGDEDLLLVEDDLELVLVDERVDERSVGVARREQAHVHHEVLDDRRARERASQSKLPQYAGQNGFGQS